eukprot:1976937-Pleurochrysis_carterae.AAC.3
MTEARVTLRSLSFKQRETQAAAKPWSGIFCARSTLNVSICWKLCIDQSRSGNSGVQDTA